MFTSWKDTSAASPQFKSGNTFLNDPYIEVSALAQRSNLYLGQTLWALPEVHLILLESHV